MISSNGLRQAWLTKHDLGASKVKKAFGLQHTFERICKQKLIVFVVIAVSLMFSADPARSSLAEHHEYLINNTYADVRHATVDLLTAFPADEHVFVGIGRSPTPIIAFLQALDAKTAINFPLSNFRYGMSTQAKLDPGSRAIVDHHFEHMFHKYRRLGKTLVFIDYMESGVTLYSVQTYYRDLRKRNKKMPPAVFVGLTEFPDFFPVIYQHKDAPKPKLIRLENNLGISVRDQEWKDMSEYEKTSLQSLWYRPPRKSRAGTYHHLIARYHSLQLKDNTSEFSHVTRQLSLDKCEMLLEVPGS